MNGGSSSKLPEKVNQKTGRAQKPGPGLPRIDPFVPRADHNPKELRSWAKRTGFNPSFSGETTSTVSDIDPNDRGGAVPDAAPMPNADSRRGVHNQVSSSAAVEAKIEPIWGRTTNAVGNKGIEINPVPGRAVADHGVQDAGLGLHDLVGGRAGKDKRRTGDEHIVGLKVEQKGVGPVGGGGMKPNSISINDTHTRNDIGNGFPEASSVAVPVGETTKNGLEKNQGDAQIDLLSESDEPGDSFLSRPQGLKCGLTENLGLPQLIYYGLQHYLSLAGSLVFIPLIMVPSMGGTDEETANVISTMLLISGVTTLLHSFFGTRLPLVQGSSFVYLAPALVIINSEDFRNLSENKFKHTMRELQGAIIVGSLFQTILGYSGLMSLILRLINPVVVAPTVAAIGLSYFTFGFPQAGACAEISMPLLLLVLICTLYLRRISVFGHHVFLIYAVPLSIAIIWACAFFMTAGGAYNYKECSPNVPSSNILLDSCRSNVFKMKRCRTDVSNAWKTAAWVRVPYPLQWGSPTFHLRTSLIMIIVSLVASADSVGSYHATSLLVDLKPPTPGVVSRGIGLEGCTSILAGLWGTGTGSTTVTENVHTIDVTKVASRRAIEIGSGFMIIFSFVGKIGAILASIPLALAAAVLCFTWALIVALGLSTLQYTQTASSRNIIIVGFSLFVSLSIPAYIQQYQPITSFILPSYLVPYAAASNGPIHTNSQSADYAINALLSLSMVVAFIVAFVLDNTVPGSRQERGAYIWSKASGSGLVGETDPSLSDYRLPPKIGNLFSWAKCVGY